MTLKDIFLKSGMKYELTSIAIVGSVTISFYAIIAAIGDVFWADVGFGIVIGAFGVKLWRW